TQTHALREDSPAIDAGAPCSDAPVDGVDQRGVPRGEDGNGDGDPGCDIGAYERVFEPDLAASMSCDPPEVAAGDNVTCTIEVTHEKFILDASLSLQTPDGTTFVSLAHPGDPWVC